MLKMLKVVPLIQSDRQFLKWREVLKWVLKSQGPLY